VNEIQEDTSKKDLGECNHCFVVRTRLVLDRIVAGSTALLVVKVARMIHRAVEVQLPALGDCLHYIMLWEERRAESVLTLV